MLKKRKSKMIDFYLETNNYIDDTYEDQFISIINKTLEILNITDDIEMSCIIVDDQRIHAINKEYRNIDRSTDVISFALEDSDSSYLEGLPRSIGDIFISYDHALSQSKEYGHSVQRELCFLFTHGLLHLLGYDHMEEDDEKEMFALQDQILNALNITRE